MRVAMDLTPLLGVRSGVARVVEGWWRGLRANPDLDMEGYTLSWADRTGAGVLAVALPLPASIATRTWRKWDRPKVDRWLDQPDLIHATNHVAPSATAPTLLTVMDLSFVHDASLVGKHIRRFDDSIRLAVERGVVLHTISQFVADELKERYGADAHVVYPGVSFGDVQVFDNQDSASGPPQIVAIGTAIERKQFPLLVEAFAAVAAYDSDVRLVIAGAEGPDSDAINERVAALSADAQSRVELVGWVDEAGIAELYSTAAVIAHPSRYEGFGLPILEAFVHGVPVVAGSGGAVAEIAGDAARLVSGSDADELGAALIDLLSDDDQRSQLVERGRLRARDFDWGTSVTKMAELYKSVGDR
ncbi:MAG: glycosyltransferase family 4 protein [Actinobacteria bacterium]|nr:glycosyltransferase family 4 protein [Actinomycetota bacterium]